VASCGGRSDTVECYDASQCSADPGESIACVDGDCTTVECLSTLDCPLGKVCDVDGQDYECVDGCNNDLDCSAGFSCSEDGICAEYGCRSSLLDCAFGEICNLESGVCEEDPRPHCQACDPLLNEWDIGEPGDNCDDFLSGNSSCGGPGAICTTFTVGDLPLTSEPICYVPCEEALDCPTGFTCSLVTFRYGNGQDPNCAPDNTYSLGFCISDCAPQ
jgi:hypothetical protein